MKKELKKGAGEILAFLFSLPILVLVFAFVLSIYQRGIIKERLEYTAYLACRKAVVAHATFNYSKTEKTGDELLDEIGNHAAKIAYDEAVKDLNKSGIKFDGSLKESLGVFLRTGDGFDFSVTPDYGSMDIADEDNEILDDELQWKKGTFINCEVSLKIKPILVFMPNVVSASVAMMVEGPASGDFQNYEWFEYGVPD